MPITYRIDYHEGRCRLDGHSPLYSGTYTAREIGNALREIGRDAPDGTVNKTDLVIFRDGAEIWRGTVEPDATGADCDPVAMFERMARFWRSERGRQYATAREVDADEAAAHCETLARTIQEET